jgi:hypothetical protein
MQNTSHAVMAQRREAPDSLDDFPTPPWATRALCALLSDQFGSLDSFTCWEPACNRGYMAEPLAEYFIDVLATDIHNYGYRCHVGTHDFLLDAPWSPAPDWIITNPPFRLAADFAARALALDPTGVALLTRTSWLEGGDRYRRLFQPRPPAIIAQFCERVPMVKGRYDPTASTATSYAWVIWADGASRWRDGTEFKWIPPCRRALERPGDYAQPVERAAA